MMMRKESDCDSRRIIQGMWSDVQTWLALKFDRACFAGKHVKTARNRSIEWTARRGQTNQCQNN
jgi:hypothetical protein